MNRIGHDEEPEQRDEPDQAPSVSAPAATRHEPTSRRTVATSAGSASSAASNVART